MTVQVKKLKPVHLTTIEVKISTRQKIKVLASLEAQTMQEWMDWMVDRAYSAKLQANRKRV